MTSSQNNSRIKEQTSRFAPLREKLNIHKTLARQASVVLTVLIAIILIASGSLLGWQFFSTQKEEILARQIALSVQATVTIEAFLDRLGGELDVLALTADGGLEEAAEKIAAIVALEPGFLEVIIVDLKGNIINSVVDDAAVLGNLFTIPQAQWFIQARQGQPYVSRLQISANNEPYVILARPITVDGDVHGVIASRVNMLTLWEIIGNIEIGQTGLAYVVDQAGILIAHPNPNIVLSGINLANDSVFASFMGKDQGFQFIGLTGLPAVGAVTTMDSLGWKVITELPTTEAFASFRRTIGLFIGFALLALFISGGLVTILVNRFVQPIVNLAKAAQLIGQGDLEQRVTVSGENELTILATSFNSMASQLRDSIYTLEERVQTRTRALEISGSVSRQLSNILERQVLVTTVVELVKESFDYYHAHIYLFDDKGENLVMVGGTGEAGKQMLANQHQIPAGRGLVGRAGQSGQSVLVLDTAEAEDWLPNPLLPDTKSETAVPIAIGQRVLGVLDVQHNVTRGLNDDSVSLLQSIANQVAIALENARLLENVRNRAELEAKINGIGQQIQATTSVEEAMQIAIRELGRVTEARYTTVQLTVKDAAVNGDKK